MTKHEQEALALQIADGSSVFDFDTALELVRLMPKKAEALLQDRKRRRDLLKKANRNRVRITISELR